MTMGIADVAQVAIIHRVYFSQMWLYSKLWKRKIWSTLSYCRGPFCRVTLDDQLLIIGFFLISTWFFCTTFFPYSPKLLKENLVTSTVQAIKSGNNYMPKPHPPLVPTPKYINLKKKLYVNYFHKLMGYLTLVEKN